MEPGKILLIGGTGFVGGWIASRLAKDGVRVLVPARHRDHCKALTVLPTVELLEADVHDRSELVALMAGVDAVINLAGILHDRDNALPFGRRFAAVHVELPRTIVAAMKEAGVRRLIHLSALKASPDAPSAYLRSKAAGEAEVLAAGSSLDVTVFRPSVIFGPDDVFLNTFATVLKTLPMFPLACGGARFQPVYVADVADAVVNVLRDRTSFGQTYALCGPRVYTLRELVDAVGQLTGNRRLIVDLPAPVARLQAGLLGCLPNPPMSPDNLRSLQIDSVMDAECSLPGWAPRSLEAVVPGYLAPLSSRRRLDNYRARAGRCA